MSETIASLGERALIERLRGRLGPSAPHIEIGIGDDAAVLAPERGTLDVVTTDALVEGVHFRRDWTRPRAIGYKALAVNLSDLAAMGASPRASFLSLALPPGLPLADFDELVDGFAALATASGAPLAGGNLASSPGPVIVDVTAVGAVRRRRVLRRAGARAGHELYVSGALGAAAAGLARLAAGEPRETMDADARACVERYELPEPRLRLGSIVGRTGAASAGMDLSDGLAQAARAIAEASGIGVVIDADALPIAPGARTWAERQGQDAVALALCGGEDYELAFAVSPRLRPRFLAAAQRVKRLTVARVGHFVPEPGAWLARNGGRTPLPEGFSHFA